MEITLDSVIDAARQRLAAVTGEVAGYVSLLTLQQVATNPCAISPSSIALTDAGDIVVRSLGPATPHELETTLRQLLSALVALSPSAAPAIKSAAERAAGGGLLALESELLAALVPINHAASRRALARLYRETQRADRAAFAAVSGSGATRSLLDASRSGAPMPLHALLPIPEVANVAGAPPASLPSAATSSPRMEPGELDIDVDVDAEVATDELQGSMQVAAQNPPLTEPHFGLDPGADAAPVEREAMDGPSEEALSELTEAPSEKPPGLDEPEVNVGCRSDLQELLASFLSYTRSEERMTLELRRMIGVDRSQANLGQGRASLFGQRSGAGPERLSSRPVERSGVITDDH